MFFQISYQLILVLTNRHRSQTDPKTFKLDAYTRIIPYDLREKIDMNFDPKKKNMN